MSTLSEVGPAATRALTRGDYKTLSLAALGGALEFYDFIIFVFFATTVGTLFFPPEIPDWLRQLQTFGIFAAGYLARPLGGIVMAHFGDLLGRKRMFTLSIFLMSVPTLLMGALPTYAQIGLWAPVLLLALRVLQGAAIGGEVPGAWVFVSEHVPARHVGYACGTLTAGLTGGILIGSLVAGAMHAAFSSEQLLAYGWRIPFLLGGAFGLISVYLRRWLHETPVFEELRQRKALAEGLPLKQVLRDNRPAVLISMLLTWLLSSGIVVLILMTPTFLQKLFGIPAAIALQANSLATLMLTFGCIAAGWIIDRIGPGRTLLGGSALLAAMSYVFYLGVQANVSWLFPLYGLLGACVGIIGTVPYVMVQSFPAAVRFSGLSFSYNMAYAVFGGLTPMVVTLLLNYDRLAPAHYVAFTCAIGMAVGCYLLRRAPRVAESG